MFKRILFLSFCLFITGSNLFSQNTEIEGGCQNITVTSLPPFPQVFFANGLTSTSYDPVTNECTKVVSSTSPNFFYQLFPQLTLSKVNSGGGLDAIDGKVGGVGTKFTNLPAGEYVVTARTPFFNENTCLQNAANNPVRSRSRLVNSIGQFLGYQGTYDNSPFGGQVTSTSELAIVGQTTQNDISFTFIDIPETGAEASYDEGEVVRIDLSDSKNYDIQRIAIFEDGPTRQAYVSNGFQSGQINEATLTDIWGLGFRVNHSYTVQLVLENDACPNTSWNQLFRTFFICPAGTGCKLSSIQQHEISTYPNPVTDILNVKNLDINLLDQGAYRYTLTEMATGRVLHNLPLVASTISVDGENLDGLHLLTVFKGEEVHYRGKVLIQ